MARVRTVTLDWLPSASSSGSAQREGSRDDKFACLLFRVSASGDWSKGGRYNKRADPLLPSDGSASQNDGDSEARPFQRINDLGEHSATADITKEVH